MNSSDSTLSQPLPPCSKNLCYLKNTLSRPSTCFQTCNAPVKLQMASPRMLALSISFFSLTTALQSTKTSKRVAGCDLLCPFSLCSLLKSTFSPSPLSVCEAEDPLSAITQDSRPWVLCNLSSTFWKLASVWLWNDAVCISWPWRGTLVKTMFNDSKWHLEVSPMNSNTDTCMLSVSQISAIIMFALPKYKGGNSTPFQEMTWRNR